MDDGWYLKQYADFVYLLVDGKEFTGKDILQKRFKKDQNAFVALLNLIEKIDELDYDDGIEFAFSSNRFDTIKGTNLSLIEIRRFNKTWRVITYWSESKKCLVMLDAFEAHKLKTMGEMIRKVEPLAKRAILLLGEGK